MPRHRLRLRHRHRLSPTARIVTLLAIAIALTLALTLATLSLIPVISVYSGEREKGHEKTYRSADTIPHRRVGLLLGTSKWTRGGHLNRYYAARLYATAELYARGKIDIVLASGDNQFLTYNEPRAMWETLVALGVRSEDIILDFAGFRTLDSILRTAKVFGITDYTIITQPPHTLRALYIAEQFGHNPIAYNAALPRDGSQLTFRLREALARIKALLDIHILHTQPRYLGPATQIPF